MPVMTSHDAGTCHMLLCMLQCLLSLLPTDAAAKSWDIRADTLIHCPSPSALRA